MAELQKAKLQKVRADENETKIGEPVPVQFNPTSLKLKLTNQVDGGRSNARQRRQQTGASSNVLSMDLIFDTADEGSPDAPVSVRTKTAIVEEFVVPKKNNPDPPPRLQFQWNELILTGIVESVDIDFDLFAANGVPLRAKVSLSIKEQRPEYQFLQGGAGANNSDNATEPGEGNADSEPGGGTNDPAGATGSAGDRSAPALAGESPAEFASRLGLDPTAWRGLSADLSAGLSLEAGVEVGFSLGLSAGVGIGVSAGVQASVGVSLEASLGLEAGVSASTRVNGDTAGKAMAAVGGVQAAIDAVAISNSSRAASAAVQSFAVDLPVDTTAGADLTASAVPVPRAGAGAAAVATAAAATIVRAPLAQTGRRSHSQQLASEPAAPPPQPDPRSISYGSGVPLQPLTQTALDPQRTRVCSGVAGADAIQPPFRSDPTVAPWVALPPIDRNRTRADALEEAKQSNPCRLVSNWCECDSS